MAGFSFPKRHRLLSPSDFERVFAAKQSTTDRLITMYALRNEYGHPRLGLVASRRIGNAVERNRWKRLLREAFRLEQHALPPFDLVCIPRAGSEPQLASLRQSILRLAGRLERRGEEEGGAK